VDFHDREGFSTPCGTKPFAIMSGRFRGVNGGTPERIIQTGTRPERVV
jgi:hypothetical protein